MKILGISCFFHDSAACLVSDGQVVAASAEERLSRVKHDNRFPFLAIEYCLQEAGVGINELDALVFYEKPLIKFERLLYQHLNHFPKSFATFRESTASWLTQKLNVQKILKEELHYTGTVQFIPHHLSHAASCYYLSPFKNATIVTLDGVGEWATTTVGTAHGNTLSIEKELPFPHSLGLLYSALTAYLGFSVNNDEYKVMGLAAYGDPTPYQKHFEKLITLHPDGSYSLNMEYFDYTWAQHMFSSKLEQLFGHPAREPESRVYRYHENIAAALQDTLEKCVFNLLTATYQRHKNPSLCLAGGVALNSVLNGKILSQTPFKKLYIAPDPSDAGGAMGAALYSYYRTRTTQRHLEQRLTQSKQFVPYVGPGYRWHQVEQAINKHQLTYQRVTDRKKLLEFVSTQLIKKKVIGWFQGRMEWGPRALGNRSILAAATSAEMKDILNAKVKHREMFRPFAPVILSKHVPDFFEIDSPLQTPAKYMLFVYPFTESGKKNIPSVVHVDGTGRLQSLDRAENPLYYDLIDTYYQKTGIPVIINTSFNIRGEPIVCTPEDAIRCFLGTEIDFLVLDSYILSKGKRRLRV